MDQVTVYDIWCPVSVSINNHEIDNERIKKHITFNKRLWDTKYKFVSQQNSVNYF